MLPRKIMTTRTNWKSFFYFTWRQKRDLPVWWSMLHQQREYQPCRKKSRAAQRCHLRWDWCSLCGGEELVSELFWRVTPLPSLPPLPFSHQTECLEQWCRNHCLIKKVRIHIRRQLTTWLLSFHGSSKNNNLSQIWKRERDEPDFLYHFVVDDKLKILCSVWKTVQMYSSIISVVDNY